jgi:tetratricopeptide (TPR) repeat protein
MNAKKGAGAAQDRRSAQAVEQYEKATKALGKHDYEKARDAFAALAASFPEERDIAERARLFEALCARSLEKHASFKPKGVDELVSYGVLLHNRAEYAEALKCFAQASEQQPKNEHALYCAAATAARLGDTDAALKALKAAIQLNTGNRAQARIDEDFDALQDNDEFLDLVDGPLD